MKKYFIFILATYCFSLSPLSHAGCGRNMNDDWHHDEATTSECQCADLGCARSFNTCLNPSDCCEAFGNIGAR